MDRSTINRQRDRQTASKAGLIISTALASIALAGCTTSAAPRAESSFSKAQAALEAGKTDKAIVHAEAAVLAEPRNPGFRAMLGAAYLEAGRFEAAATTFNDALELGDTDPRTTLSYALASIATGDSAKAITALEERETLINPADFGLALALAGNPEKAIHVLTNALRAGQNTAKLRQNLAYTYALAGNWRAARVMAAEDVPADQLDARLTEWAENSKPEDVTKRVANLLGVTPSAGAQPRQLALANFSGQQALVAEAATQVEVVAEAAPAPARELGDADLAVAASNESEASVSESEALAFGIDQADEGDSRVETIDPTVANILRATSGSASAAPIPTVASASPASSAPAASVPAAKTAPAPTSDKPTDWAKADDAGKTEVAGKPAASGTRYISRAVVQALPQRSVSDSKAPRRVASATPKPAPKPAPRRASSSDQGANSHLVQLGSYSSRSEASQGWSSLKRKFPQLADHDVVITKARVNGKIYYRVAAAGFGPRSARSLCGTVKSAGRGCFAYAAANPPKGAIDNGTRVAARSR